MDGQFSISVSGSNPILVFEYMGYITQEINVKGKQTIKVIMQPNVNQLDEVVLSVQAKGQKKAISEQLNSNTIKNVVAADRLQENPDANSVEAIGRLPGVSVVRDGGEGSVLIVRGLQPKYTAVTLNGVKMASNSADGRETNISGISQYALQGVEVYKSLTAEMEANSVAGTINLKLRETPKGLHGNIMNTTGYNNLNNYIGNYRWQGEVGNRFFNDKLGVFVSLGTESVNRGAQTVNSGYEAAPTTTVGKEIDLLTSGTALNLKNRIKFRDSGLLTLDYRLGTTTKIGLYGLYNRSNNRDNTQSKSYSSAGSGAVNYNFTMNNTRVDELYQSSLSAETDLKFMKIDYGVTVSEAKTDDPNSRRWAYTALNPQDLINVVLTQDFRRDLQPEDVPLLYNDNAQNINKFVLNSFGVSSEFMTDKNLDAYANLTIPLKIGDKIKASVKTGYAYRNKNRLRDVNGGSTQAGTNQFFRRDIVKDLPWIVADAAGNITAEGMQDGSVNDFLNGRYNFGPTFNFDRLNQITDSWDKTSEFWFNQGEAVWITQYPKDKIGRNQDIAFSTLNDQDIEETYQAGYLMAQFNVGKWLMFLPGVRYENTTTLMQGFASFQPSTPAPIYEQLPGSTTLASTSNEFFLPMVHLRISPSDSFYTHLAYTQTLSRPQLDQISPNSWTNTGFPPFSYISNMPDLRVEEWENYDLQFVYHSKKISLMSVSGFYKKVNNQIWTRSFRRIKGDPLIDPFPDSALVNVTRPENHPNEIVLKGFEFELQTSFGYLSNFLKYFTTSLNYTFTDSQTFFPISRLETTTTPNPNGGRPIVTTVRIESLVSGPMLFQPKHIANASLGFNKKGLNVWLSYQFSGGVFESIHPQFNSLDLQKNEFSRWDLQVSQKLFGLFKGFQVIGNFANLNGSVEAKKYRGDPRLLSIEQYGWTMDLGVRYSF
jgi:TonB-dependent receptor